MNEYGGTYWLPMPGSKNIGYQDMYPVKMPGRSEEDPRYNFSGWYSHIYTKWGMQYFGWHAAGKTVRVSTRGCNTMPVVSV